MYASKDIARLFAISAQSVRTYANEFADYLSPTANPEKGAQRNFSEADVRVFALIADLKGLGKTYDQIHAALAAGQRGDMPSSTPIAAQNEPSGIIQLRRDVTRLQSELLMTEGQNQLLREQLEQKEQQIKELYREIGRLEARLDKGE